MEQETKQALDNAFDIIAEMIDHINDLNLEIGNRHPNSNDIVNRAVGVKNEINEELYKTL